MAVAGCCQTLRLIKNYLRSTMLQDRLPRLAKGLLRIENEHAKQMDVDEVVIIFAEKKCHRRKI